MDASELAALSALLAAEVRQRGWKRSPSNRERQAMMSAILEEIGLGEVKIRRALYTLRRRMAAHERINRRAS